MTGVQTCALPISAGDELLKQVAQRLQRVLTDKSFEIGRLGGDEFQIMLPDIDDRGRLVCRADLSVADTPDAWGAGDCAAIPDLTRPGETCPPSAQHAVRQAKVVADNVLASLRGEPTDDYVHANNGSVASLGLYKGVAQVKGVQLKGFPAWFLHRTYHMSKVPTTRRKVSVVTDWTIAFFFKRDVTSLWPTHEPLHDFSAVARGRLPSDPQ